MRTSEAGSRSAPRRKPIRQAEPRHDVCKGRFQTRDAMNANHPEIIAGAFFIVMMSCGRPETPPGPAPTMTTSAQRIRNDDAAMVLTNARCQREHACDNVGAFRRFTDHDACRRELFAEARPVLRPEACPLGVDEDQLSRCLSDVRKQECGAARATMSEPASCGRSDLCIPQ
jgi:hypothetical protein